MIQSLPFILPFLLDYGVRHHHYKNYNKKSSYCHESNEDILQDSRIFTLNKPEQRQHINTKYVFLEDGDCWCWISLKRTTEMLYHIRHSFSYSSILTLKVSGFPKQQNPEQPILSNTQISATINIDWPHDGAITMTFTSWETSRELWGPNTTYFCIILVLRTAGAPCLRQTTVISVFLQQETQLFICDSWKSVETDQSRLVIQW